ncbi:hypothetical protein E1A91_D04G201800v1 [Gossypium mustelinum]|uniref:TF-B3 domain-containing protein n=1 Tax=Gossypium mustelinum TaxID=34275 RepID=A0A5D2VGU6_GOSMU|nr:hypothetical protein E1A91_D04G201800v1 [Gossypium mustelinum]
MEVIMDEVNLEARHVLRWKFRDHSRTLSGCRIDLAVTDGNERWQFECCRSEEGDNTYYIRCPAWSDFVRPRINARLTLYAKQANENFHRVRVIRRD